MINQFNVLVWKDDNSLYFPSGQYKNISCSHINDGPFSVNISGAPVPVDSTTLPPLATGSASDSQRQMAEVLPGNVYGSATPFPTGSAKAKQCIRIKDMKTLITYYVDAADYATKVVACNTTP